MNIVLVTLNSKYIHTNLAIRLLYNLYRETFNISYREFTIREEAEKIADSIQSFDVVAFSCYIWNIIPTLTVIRIIKSRNPKVKIILGGPEVSYENDELIRNPDIDFIIEGEGEISFGELIQSIDFPENICGVVYKKEGQVIRNLPVSPVPVSYIESINPYQFDAPNELLNKILYIETSRGCPYKCEFCLASLDNKIRNFSNEAVFKHLDFLMEYGKTIKFLDRTFNIRTPFTIDIFQYIINNHSTNNIFQFEITAEILHRDVINFIQNNVPKGLFRFEIGIQSTHDSANKSVSRKQNFTKVKEVILEIKDKVDLHLDLIAGMPHDTYEDICVSIEDVISLNPPELQLGFMKLLKGTPLRTRASEEGYVYSNIPPYQLIQNKYISVQELNKISAAEESIEIYWNSGRARRGLSGIQQYKPLYKILEKSGIDFLNNLKLKSFSVRQIFDILYKAVVEVYPDDIWIHDEIALDYYLCSYYRPEPRYIIPETSGKIKPAWGDSWIRIYVVCVTKPGGSNERIKILYNGKTRPEYVIL